jgi:hypothetical protein
MAITIEEAMELASEWAEVEGVIMVGQGRLGDRDCIEVMATVSAEELEGKIPSEFHGFPVVLSAEEPPISAGG